MHKIRSATFPQTTAVALLALSGSFLHSCQPRSFNKKSALMHAQGDVSKETSALDWQTLTDEELTKFVLTSSHGKPVPAENPLVKRLQGWADLLDQRLRQEHPEDLQRVPSPKILLTENQEANAFVPMVPICFRAPVQNTPLNSTSPQQNTAALTWDKQGKLVAFPGKCLERPASETLMSELVALHNDRTDSCALVFENGNIAPRTACVSENPSPALRADRLVYQPFVSAVVIYRGLLKMYSNEAEALTVVAHELGHYYQAHATAAQRNYNFFYRHDQTALPRRPVIDPELNRIGRDLVQLQSMKRAPQVQGQHFHTFAFAHLGPYGAVGNALKKACSPQATPCEQGCKPFFTGMQSAEASRFLRSALTQNIVEPALFAAYLELEQKFLTCVAQPVGLPMARTIWPQIKEQVSREFPELTENLTEPTDSTTLADFLELASTEARKLEDRLTQAKARIVTDRLGLYTTEQEADDLSLEFLARLGINPQVAEQAHVTLLKFTAATEIPEPGEIPAMECLDLFNHDWKDKANQPVFVPVLRWKNPYHSACYRLYNISREVTAHHYQVNTPFRPLLTGEEWSTLVNAP